MSMDDILIGGIFAGAIILVVIAIEGGEMLGRAILRRGKSEKESTASATAAVIMGLLSFMLVFTFGIVTNKYFDRSELVRNEANSIRTAWLRSDFLAESDRGETVKLLREYVELRIDLIQSRDIDQINKNLSASTRIQRQLWDIAVANARKDMNSNTGTLYIESLNEIISVQALRINAGLQMRIPGGIWHILIILLILGMVALGYQAAMSGVRRSWITPILALSFSLVITMIADLDRLHGTFMSVSQEPMMNLRTHMVAPVEARPGLQYLPKMGP